MFSMMDVDRKQVKARELHDDDLLLPPSSVPRGHPYPTRRIWAVHVSGEGRCDPRYCSNRAAETGRIHLNCGNGAGGEQTRSYDPDTLVTIACPHHDAARLGHIREAMAVMDDGYLVGDCSCGAEYTAVPVRGDEYGALEAAHRAHIAEAEGGGRAT